LRKYGTDKPDLRNPIEMEDATEHFKGSGFKVFAGMIEMDANTRVWAIPAKGGGSRAVCDRMNAWAQSEGQPGLGYIFYRASGATGETFEPILPPELSSQTAKPVEIGPREIAEGSGPVAKNLGASATESIRQQLGLKIGDAVFFVAGLPKEMASFAGLARTKVGTDLGLVAQDRFEFCWIVDFPMYEWNEEEGRIDFSHNPFSMPQGGLEALETKDPLDILAYQYDIVCNGVELSSGAIRNHKPEIMEKAFAIAGYPKAELEQRFGGMLRALHYGAPPHGGIAPGIDRIVMLLCGEENLRQVVMFPMNQQAEDLLMGAPSEATPKQLKELHIKLDLPKTKG
jgi:aspartyl-tRNA synthetase